MTAAWYRIDISAILKIAVPVAYRRYTVHRPNLPWPKIDMTMNYKFELVNEWSHLFFIYGFYITVGLFTRVNLTQFSAYA